MRHVQLYWEVYVTLQNPTKIGKHLSVFLLFTFFILYLLFVCCFGLPQLSELFKGVVVNGIIE